MSGWGEHLPPQGSPDKTGTNKAITLEHVLGDDHFSGLEK
jgi:hypothetical protein